MFHIFSLSIFGSCSSASDKITFARTSNRKIEMAKVIWFPYKAFASTIAWVCVQVWVCLCIFNDEAHGFVCLLTSPYQLVMLRQQCGDDIPIPRLCMKVMATMATDERERVCDALQMKFQWWDVVAVAASVPESIECTRLLAQECWQMEANLQ